jgi:hypothetical protein
MHPILLERRNESDGLIESETLRIAETLMRSIAEMDEIDLGRERIASSRHPRFPKAATTGSDQGMDKNSVENTR